MLVYYILMNLVSIKYVVLIISTPILEQLFSVKLFKRFKKNCFICKYIIL